MSDEGLISHGNDRTTLDQAVSNIQSYLHESQDAAFKEQALDLLDQLQQFEFGRFLIVNRGINGFWTHYMLTYPWYGAKTGVSSDDRPLGHFERFILERSPIIRATQQRFEIFLRENQKSVKPGARLACIPCGMMGELLYLDFSMIQNIELIGIDIDEATFNDAKVLATERGLLAHCQFIAADAWAININDEYDLISSNGLNIYQPDVEKVVALYRNFYQALKPGGRLVTSFLTPPPVLSSESEWQMEKIDVEALKIQKLLFSDVIKVRWEQAFATTEQTRQQLNAAGFSDIEFIYDEAHVFPTVVATKSTQSQ